MKTTKEIPILPPDSLLLSPCKPTPAGTTGGATVEAYIEDVYCISKYEKTLDTLRKWKQQKQELYREK
jgi:hypothetical protein